jgi:hypothetical protein
VRLALSIALIALACPVIAAVSPPPPPPEYVWNAGKLLTTPGVRNASALAPLFADDVMAFQNGKLIAKGKEAWLKWMAVAPGARVLGFSESSAGYGDAGGELLIVDTFDTVDRTNLPRGFVADPRMASRPTLYQFGADHLIHFVRISRTAGFWMRPAE